MPQEEDKKEKNKTAIEEKLQQVKRDKRAIEAMLRANVSAGGGFLSAERITKAQQTLAKMDQAIELYNNHHEPRSLKV